MLKKVLVICALCLLVTVNVSAFLYQAKILNVEEIQKLDDDELVELYIQARIEEKASGEFHRAAGFSSAKDYGGRKLLLRYLFELRREMGRREKIQATDVDDYFE